MKHTDWQHMGLCIAIIWGGFALRLYRLGAPSLWYDETVSAYLARQSVPDLIHHTVHDIHPPAYYVFLHYWMRWVGDSEFALAFFSLIFGVLLIALTHRLACRLLGQQAALWSAFLVAISPFHLWYSQEVRMYTLAAVVGMLAWWYAWRIFQGERRTIGYYVLAAASGLYILYYFAFLLIAIHLAVLLCVVSTSQHSRSWLPGWLLAQGLVLALYVPWLPIAWRQAVEPPVPPWRSFVPWHLALVETWSAFAFGQSVQWEQIWPLLVMVGGLFGLGLAVHLKTLHQKRCAPLVGFGHLSGRGVSIWLASITLGPLLLINLGSLLTPLYHVRYTFTYSPPFYMLVGAGLAWLVQRMRFAGALSVLGLLLGTGFSFWQLHTHPAYTADDLRGAVQFMAARWRPGDAILIHAGYAYPAFLYYYRAPLAARMRLDDYRSSVPSAHPLVLQTGIIGGSDHLGWGDAAADFYPTTEADTALALARVLRDYPRVWVLRIYDTVADGKGFVRRWLAEHTIPFEDQLFAGSSYVRVQGFMARHQPLPPPSQPVALEGDIALRGWTCPAETPVGAFLDVVLWWEITGERPRHSPPYAVSLKLWSAQDQKLAAQQDEWPLGNLLWTPAWPQYLPMRHPMRLEIPHQLSPGRYRLELQVYDSVTVRPFARLDGAGNALTLAWITVTPPEHTLSLGYPGPPRYNPDTNEMR
ncbi:MAG: glycosyltransferase family 39 protein [Anaerolineae bacterium]|nr:glycosyltransferase family 39 protein [Anaerolineae bacterium]MDW8070071.1 glycosyltransferase family 39 protein [Anaerolineae bacterium]